MMRSFRRLRSFPGFAARGAICMFLAAFATGPGIARAQADSALGGPAWLPLPVEDIDDPELLDEPFAPDLGFLVRADVRDGRLRQARSAVTAAGRGVTAGVALLTGPGGDARAVSGWVRAPRLALDAGRLNARGVAPLVGEEIGLVTRSGLVPQPRVRSPAFAAPTSGSMRALDGAALSWRPRAERGLAMWIVAGRRVGDSVPVGALGAAVRGRRVAWSVILARSRSATAGVTAELRSREGRRYLAFEASRGPSGTAVIAAASRSAGPLRVKGRWSWRSRELRQVSSDVIGEAGTRGARVRLRLAGNPSGAAGSVSRVELEGRLAPHGSGPFAVRIGTVRSESFSNAAGFHTTLERYGLAELTVARADGRTLTLLGSRRDKETRTGARRGSSLGGRVGLEWPGRASVEIQLEGIRADAEGAAWSSGLYAGGATALRTRARPGIAAGARGAIRLGRWTVGCLVEERDDALGGRATALSLWIGREGGARPWPG